jgi:hypothetical protein
MDVMCLKLATNIVDLDSAFRIALGDIFGNIHPYRDGLLREEAPTLLAGLGYDTPWTRDAAINTWNFGGLLHPEACRNALLSVLEEHDGQPRIGGQYWDSIIWVIGAWWLYLFTGDREFLALAHQAAENTLETLEKSEFSASLNLFRGPACYGDGVAAYPDVYARVDWSGIDAVPRAHPELCVGTGNGIPMHALSTNCLYFQAYILLDRISRELGLPARPDCLEKAAALKAAINRHFWKEEAGSYRYLVDPFGGCEHQEGLGSSFAILFGIANADQARRIFTSQHICRAGIPCVWPSFERYTSLGEGSYGRHSGTVWPQIQAFWADAAALHREEALFSYEFHELMRHAVRDSHFAEIYHPDDGRVYGGLQETRANKITPWESARRQTWCATGFVRMVLSGIAGMRLEPAGIRFAPMMIQGMERLELNYLRYRAMEVNIRIEGTGSRIVEFAVNGEPRGDSFLGANASGRQDISITVAR